MIGHLIATHGIHVLVALLGLVAAFAHPVCIAATASGLWATLVEAPAHRRQATM